LEEKPFIKYIFCLFRCILWCLEKCARWMCKKVYIETCIHGTWFCTSLCQVAKALINMLTYITIAEFISTLMLFFGKLSIAFGTAGIAGYIFNEYFDMTSIIFPTILVLIMSFAVASMFVQVYDMCIDTMLMCFCEAKLDDSGTVCVPKQLETYMGEQYTAHQQEVADTDSAIADAEVVENLPPALLTEMKEKFARYDLDKSGTINSKEELQQLMTNLYFSLSGKGLSASIKPDDIAARVTAAGDMEKNNWSFNAWAGWCKREFPEIMEWSG